MSGKGSGLNRKVLFFLLVFTILLHFSSNTRTNERTSVKVARTKIAHRPPVLIAVGTRWITSCILMRCCDGKSLVPLPPFVCVRTFRRLSCPGVTGQLAPGSDGTVETTNSDHFNSELEGPPDLPNQKGFILWANDFLMFYCCRIPQIDWSDPSV